MIWQDWAMALITFVFPISLIPSIRKKHYPAVSTSLTTGTALVALGLISFTIPFYFLPTMNMVTAFGWFTLAFLRYRQ